MMPIFARKVLPANLAKEPKGDIVAVSNTENGWVSKDTKLGFLEFLEFHCTVGPHVIPKLVTFAT